MIVIGIAGGIASGKSFVADQFAKLGALVLDADRAGHQVLLEDNIKKQILQTFGESVFADNGEIDRRKLGEIVFHSSDADVQLRLLEKITHPRIRELLNQQITELKTGAQSGDNDTSVKAVVLDAPVMFKSGWNDFCDAIVFVDTPLQTRKQRTIERGWSNSELEKREAMQTPVEEKRSQSDFIIHNDGSPDETLKQVKQIWIELISNQKD